MAAVRLGMAVGLWGHRVAIDDGPRGGILVNVAMVEIVGVLLGSAWNRIVQ